MKLVVRVPNRTSQPWCGQQPSELEILLASCFLSFFLSWLTCVISKIQTTLPGTVQCFFGYTVKLIWPIICLTLYDRVYADIFTGCLELSILHGNCFCVVTLSVLNNHSKFWRFLNVLQFPAANFQVKVKCC
jgi:hypothetical protein